MHPSPAQHPSPAPDPSTALQVPRSAVVVVATTPQDRALVPVEHTSCGCPPAAVTLLGHAEGCLDRT